MTGAQQFVAAGNEWNNYGGERDSKVKVRAIHARSNVVCIYFVDGSGIVIAKNLNADSQIALKVEVMS